MTAKSDFQQISLWRDDCPDADSIYEVTNPMDNVDLSDEALIRAANGYAIMMLDDPRPLPHTDEELESATRAVISYLRAQSQPDRPATNCAPARWEPWLAAPDEPTEGASGHGAIPSSDNGGWPRDPRKA